MWPAERLDLAASPSLKKAQVEKSPAERSRGRARAWGDLAAREAARRRCEVAARWRDVTAGGAHPDGESVHHLRRILTRKAPFPPSPSLVSPLQWPVWEKSTSVSSVLPSRSAAASPSCAPWSGLPIDLTPFLDLDLLPFQISLVLEIAQQLTSAFIF
jgi:hypothetical protein